MTWPRSSPCGSSARASTSGLAHAAVHLPALRDRLEDVPLLVTRLLDDLGRPDVRLAEATREVLPAEKAMLERLRHEKVERYGL